MGMIHTQSPSASAAATWPTKVTPTFLSNPPSRLILFGGKGGVGKTTVSCASAMALARSMPDRRVCLISTDPAHSVYDCLAQGEAMGDAPNNLEAEEFDAMSRFGSFLDANREAMRLIGERGTLLDRNEIDPLLELTMPGVDELMGLLRVAERADEPDDPMVVVDTAPTGHALRLLRTPDLITRWVNAFDALLAKHRTMREVFSGNGIDDEDPAERLIAWLEGRAQRAREMLTHNATGAFVTVTLAEPMVMAETLALLDSLREDDMALGGVVVNRCPMGASGHARAKEVLDLLADRHAEQQLWALPRGDEEIRGATLLEAFAGRYAPLGAVAETIRAEDHASPACASKVGGTVVPITSEHRLVMFGGKGGVGKTTLAASMACAVADAASRRPVLLVSTDPAHSLGHLFGREIGAAPTAITDRLHALHVDSDAAFDRLRSRFDKEIAKAIEKLTPSGADASMDREAMSRLLDVTPPGLDELMGMLEVATLLEANPDHLVVVDSAPTGHLLRLLEGPNLVGQWARTLLDLLGGITSIVQLPKLTGKISGIARSAQRLQSAMRSPTEGLLIPVAIPTRMAWEETGDLVERCGQLGVPLGPIVVNQVDTATAAGVDRFSERFPELGVVTVQRTAVADVEGLTRLGAALLEQGARP